MPASLTESTCALRAHVSPDASTPSMGEYQDSSGSGSGGPAEDEAGGDGGAGANAKMPVGRPSSHEEHHYPYRHSSSFGRRNDTHSPSHFYSSHSHAHNDSPAVARPLPAAIAPERSGHHKSKQHSPHHSRGSGWSRSGPTDGIPAEQRTSEKQPVRAASSTTNASSRRDPEKYAMAADSESGFSHVAYEEPYTPETLRSPRHISFGDEAADDGEPEERYESRLGWILIHLSLPSPFIALGLALYAILALILQTLLAPLALCTSRPSWSRTIYTAVAPALRIQLRLISDDSALCRPYAARAARTCRSSRSPRCPRSPTLHPQIGAGAACRTLLTTVLAPLVALPVMLCAWTVGVFWLFALAVGLPGGQRRGAGAETDDVEDDAVEDIRERGAKDAEGRTAARWVRRVWRAWLGWGIWGLGGR